MADLVHVAIDGADDPRIADYLALTDVELRRRSEPAAGIFIAEGAIVIGRAARAGYPLRSVLCSPRWVESIAEPARVSVPAGGAVSIFLASDDVLQQITGYHVHRGALASFERRPLPTLAEILRGSRRLAVLEDVNTHTNLGAILRCAAALGMDAAVLSPRCADPLYRRAVRVSMGEVFALPYTRAPHWPGALDDLRAAGFRLVALTPDPAAVPIGEAGLPRQPRTALLLGAEGPGLSAVALARADLSVRIPMARGVDSLNVAAAAAVAFFVAGSREPPLERDP